jgi:hypothetical protein
MEAAVPTLRLKLVCENVAYRVATKIHYIKVDILPLPSENLSDNEDKFNTIWNYKLGTKMTQTLLWQLLGCQLWLRLVRFPRPRH